MAKARFVRLMLLFLATNGVGGGQIIREIREIRGSLRFYEIKAGLEACGARATGTGPEEGPRISRISRMGRGTDEGFLRYQRWMRRRQEVRRSCFIRIRTGKSGWAIRWNG